MTQENYCLATQLNVILQSIWLMGICIGRQVAKLLCTVFDEMIFVFRRAIGR